MTDGAHHKMTKKTLEDLVEDVGGCGPFQFLLIPLGFANVIVSVWSMMFMVFGALEPDWSCVSRDLLGNQSHALSLNASGVVTMSGAHSTDASAAWTEAYIISMNGSGGLGANVSHSKVCGAAERDDGGCDEIVFAEGINTIVSQFQLVCGLSWVPSVMISLQMVGVLIGASVSGQLGDSWGRKKTIIVITTLHATFNLVAAFSVNWQMFAVLRTLLGMTTGGILATGFAYTTEFVGVRWRAIVGSVPMWGLGAATCSLLVWLLPDWNHIHLATAAFSAACLPAWLFLPESVRWLAVKGHVIHAQQVLRKMAYWNRRAQPSVASMNCLYCDTDEPPRKYNYFHMFSSCYMIKISVLNGFMWFCCSLTYYGISFGIKNLAGDFFLNFFLMAVVEVPPSLFVYHLSGWLGRRWTLFSSFMLVSLSILTVVPLLLLLPEDESGTYVNILCIAARAGLNLGWNAMTVYVVELYPTVVRIIALGYCNTTARLAGIVAPYVLSAGEPYVFYVVIGAAMALTAISPLLMDETKGRPLQDDLPHAQKLLTPTIEQNGSELQTM